MKFLYIEDIEANARVISLFVEALWGDKAEIDIVETAEDGFKKIEEETYDIVFMDINLPQMDGVEAIKIIREKYSITDLPVIALSADATKHTKRLTLDAGANEYITKPVFTNHFKDVTERCMAMKAQCS